MAMTLLTYPNATHEIDEIVRHNLMALMRYRGMSAAELSRKAGLNARAVTDIAERRTQSPRVTTVFALASALRVSPEDLFGFSNSMDGTAGLGTGLDDHLADMAEPKQNQSLMSLVDGILYRRQASVA